MYQAEVHKAITASSIIEEYLRYHTCIKHLSPAMNKKKTLLIL